ncbi:uncharacterized protein IWZ02DRAFT_188736 [Phyllosticta citriasiana]|uniref:Myb-like domain-containing protein n=1 Tax=Phyllosticta citriasiana TaxID=595635 RepID=A0ABR1KLK6_9PEZI
MDRVKKFVSQNFKTDLDKFGYWEAFGSLLLTPFEVQQRKYAVYPKPKHVETQAEVNTANDAATNEAEMAKQTSNGKPGQDGQGGDVSFTPAEDATIKEMKDRGDSWRQIAQALKKPQNFVKKRYHEIATPEQKAAAANNAGEKKGEQAKKVQQAPKTKASDGKNKEASEVKTDGNPDRSAPTISPPQYINGLQAVYVRPDDTFSANDLVWFCNAFMHDNAERWIRLASRYYDLTGRRIHPSVIKKKLMESGLPS